MILKFAVWVAETGVMGQLEAEDSILVMNERTEVRWEQTRFGFEREDKQLMFDAVKKAWSVEGCILRQR